VDGLAQNSVYSVHRDRDGTVWAGTVTGGVSRLKNGRFTNYSAANGLASNTVNSIVEAADGTVWFATPGGLEAFADGRWTNRTAEDGLPSSDVKSIFEDSKHVLWIATTGGLAYFSSGHVSVPRNLPELLREEIFGIAEDGLGSLWFATSDHVVEVSRDALLAGSPDDSDIRSFGFADGLQGVEGVSQGRSMVADALGRIWVTTNRGLAVADPKRFLKRSAPVSVRIESMSSGGTLVDLRAAPRLPAGNKNITFNYESTSLSGSEHILFRYKLDGSDLGWSNDVALRQVIYTNLGPGSYCFRVVASNSEGLWNGPETDIPFVIEPAFWQTWWFKALCVSIGILLLLAIYRLRMYQITRQLSLRFHERLAERTRIARDLHDTLLQGVLSASMQLDLAEDQLPDNSPTKPRLKRVLELLGQVTEEGRGTLQGLRSTDSEKLSLERAFSRLKQDLGNDEEIGYRVVVNGEPNTLRPLIRDEVYRIGREALVNAFTHAHAKNIEVEVEYADRQFRMLVRDDGSGIDPQVLDHGREGHWGLSGIRERSEGVGGTLHLRSRVGAGTEIELTIPSTVAFEKQRHSSPPIWRRWLNRDKQQTGPESKLKR
jgi:signal transduction histidine kinase